MPDAKLNQLLQIFDSMNLSNDLLLIGAPSGDGIFNGSGVAYLFELGNSTWNLNKKLFAEDLDSNETNGNFF